MAFQVTQETLEALEWPKVVALLREQCHTAQGQEWLTEAEKNLAVENSTVTAPASPATTFRPITPARLFEPTLQGLHARLRETDEARSLLDANQAPPLGATADLNSALSRAEKGGVLEVGQILEVRTILEILRQTARFLRRNAEQAPGLAETSEAVREHASLEKEIDRCVDPSGEIRDQASAKLASARREIVQLSRELQQRLDRYVRSPEVSRHLSDSYYTVRNDRYVLPVKADARSRIKGIVHDASRSGTTLFVEPEAVVEVNNRLKQAELSVGREIQRVLGQLTEGVSEASSEIRSGLDALARLDLAFARGRLSQQMDATSPQVDEGAVFELPGLRHPLIETSECVANDLRLGDDFSILVLSGPNAEGNGRRRSTLRKRQRGIRSGKLGPYLSRPRRGARRVFGLGRRRPHGDAERRTGKSRLSARTRRSQTREDAQRVGHEPRCPSKREEPGDSDASRRRECA